ncbi:hypothetical protein J2Z31_005962 [Sinorhizobium kostiense]|uniref:Transposase n=1 Tax=Sinorhizobium kostiense TaxID=76747 RepID=A0ABS4RAQ8_9HYPH|nr:hypothetical protein [Sinorhizobium kostiense]
MLQEVRTPSQALMLHYHKVQFILDPTDLASKKVIVCDYPDGRLDVTHEGTSLPYDTLRSVHRSEMLENKRLDDMLRLGAEMQAGREQQRSKSGPRRTGQTDHMEYGIAIRPVSRRARSGR